MLRLDLTNITNFVSDIVGLVVDPKESLVRFKYGQLLTKNDVSPIGIYIVSSIAVIAIYSILSLSQVSQLYTALAIAIYTCARMAYASIIIYLSFFIWSKFDKKLAYEHCQMFLVSTAVWSIPLVIILVTTMRYYGVDLIQMCALQTGKIEDINGLRLPSIIIMLMVFSSIMGYVYFFIFSYNLGYYFKNSVVPFVFSMFIVYPFLRPYVVVPLEALICGSP